MPIKKELTLIKSKNKNCPRPFGVRLNLRLSANYSSRQKALKDIMKVKMLLKKLSKCLN